MTPAEFTAWMEFRDFRDFYGLTVNELAFMFLRHPSTIKAKLSGNKRLTVIRGWMQDKILVIASGTRPYRWPHDLPPYPLEPLSERRRRRILKARREMGEKSYPADPLSARFRR